MLHFGFGENLSLEESDANLNYYKKNYKTFEKKIDLPKEIYNAIDFNKSVVAGSFALQKLTGGDWEPNDVDIMLLASSKEEFDQEAYKFQQKSNANLIKEAWFSESRNLIEPKTSIDELFHESVLGSKTYTIQNFPLPVQLIALDPTKKSIMINRNIHDILNETTDVPSCVNFTVVEGKKIFHIPEKGCEILFTGRGNQKDICKSRMEKYMQRGFQFY